MKYKELQGLLSLKYLENKNLKKFNENDFMEFMCFSKKLENLDLLVNGREVDNIKIDFDKKIINLEG